MDLITEVVLEYLNLNTNNALVITGDYGIGKTHFFKTQLSPEISKTPTITNASKNYKPIIISLFGIKSIEDLQTQIFISIFPLLKNKTVKLTIGLTKSIARGIANVTRIGNIDDYITDFQTVSNESLSYSDLVICFDDLERKSEKLSLIEIFGFINSIVENENAKIILITNEDKLDEDYKDLLKEKVVGNTIHYVPNIKQTFNEIITERYKSTFNLYFEFLLANQPIILKALSNANYNFRILIFFLEYFKTIYSVFIKSRQEVGKEISLIEKDKLQNILSFSLAISIEYKKGSISYLNKKNIDNKYSSVPVSDIDFTPARITNDNSEKDPYEYKRVFLGLYEFSINTYHFYESIFNYITGGSGFKFEFLEKELNEAYFTTVSISSEKEEILQKLDYRNYFKLNDKDYKSYTYKMLQYVDKGEYSLINYTYAFGFALRFSNILNFNIEKLTERFIRGIKKGSKSYEYDDDLDMKISITNDVDYYKERLEIAKECLLLNSSLKENINEAAQIELSKLFSSNLNLFIEKVDDRNSEYILKSIFNGFEFKSTFKTINSFSIEQLLKFTLFLKRRYSKSLQEYYYLDKLFFDYLKKKLSPETKIRMVKNLRNQHLNNLLEVVEQVITNLER